MVRKRTTDWKPLTHKEQAEVAMAVYKSKFPDDDAPDESDVRWELDERDWDAAATPAAWEWMTTQARGLFEAGLNHPGHPRQKLRTAAVLAARAAGGGEVYREDVLNAMERAGVLPANEDDVDTVQNLAGQVELVAFLPPDEPLHTADSVGELLERLDYEQVRNLARGALIGAGILGADLEWSSDHVEWVCTALIEETPAGIPDVSDDDPGVANWWRRLLGGRDPLDAEGQEIVWEPGPDEDPGFEPPMWRPASARE